jgi:[protein-PII] uridylyltransferase
MCGIFAAHNIDILWANLSISRDGHALLDFRVLDALGHPLREAERWEDVRADLWTVLSGRERVENLVREKFRPSLFKGKTARRLSTKIEIDNDVSAFYTVIDVYSQNRTGLLYQVTSTLAALGLYVDVSKISTKVDQVADTFYVRDIFGHKIRDEARLTRIKEILFRVIDEEPTPEWKVPV